jgi:hypothetical protein
VLSELEAENRMAARNEFVLAAWQGREPSELLSLANAAGLTGAEADRLVERIGKGKEQVEHANRLPRLRKESAAVDARFEKIQSHAAAEIERLEGERESAAAEADAACKAVYAAENSARELLLMHDEGLLPTEHTPKEIRALLVRRDATERARRADSARVAALRERNRRRAVVADTEAMLEKARASIVIERNEPRLEERVKKAKQSLREAEDQLKVAEAAAEAAREAIP